MFVTCVCIFVFNISENFTNRGHFLSDTKQKIEEIYLGFKYVSDSEHVSPDMQLFVSEKTQGACSLQPTVMQSLISPMLKNGQAIPFPSYSASIKLTVHLMYIVCNHDVCTWLCGSENTACTPCYSTVSKVLTVINMGQQGAGPWLGPSRARRRGSHLWLASLRPS